MQSIPPVVVAVAAVVVVVVGGGGGGGPQDDVPSPKPCPTFSERCNGEQGCPHFRGITYPLGKSAEWRLSDHVEVEIVFSPWKINFHFVLKTV